jgi:hypothetical protein
MPNAPAPRSTPSNAFPGSPAETPSQPRVLLVEPEVDLLANRAQLLTGSSYSVTTVSSQSDVLGLHRDEGFSLAVLNDTLGQPVLRAVAKCVRRTWPSARILILRRVESALEDHLYDEAIHSPFPSNALLNALVKLGGDPWNQRHLERQTKGHSQRPPVDDGSQKHV